MSGWNQQLGYKISPPLSESTFARVTLTQSNPDKIEETIKIYKKSVVPDAQAQNGFRGIYLLSDFKTGKSISIAIWDTEEDAIANEQSGYYKEQVDRFKDIMTAPPIREGYIVTVQE
ncbi:antibiotic biosynthesis monooxygenase family protein [Candidatus Latescibacterota bacterium]